MSVDMTCRAVEELSLRNDGGADITFKGRLFSECSWYDEEAGVLTRQKLFITDNNEQVYYIVTACGTVRSRRAYRLRLEGDQCVIHNGNSEMVVQLELLMLAVRSLCGFDAAGDHLLASIEETLKAANG